MKLIRVVLHGNPAVLALSSRTWLNYTYQNMMHFIPLIYENLESAWTFSAELVPNGFIGVSGSVLRCVLCTHPTRSRADPSCSIFHITKLGSKLKQDVIPLDNTPRKFVAHPANGFFYLIESDHRAYSASAAEQELERLVSMPLWCL